MTLRASELHVQRGGRREAILRATARRALTMSEVVTAVRLNTKARFDPSVERLKTAEALKNLRRLGLVARTPHGWLITIHGQRALNRPASEGGRNAIR